MLAQEIRNQTDNRWNFVRLYDSTKILFKKKGVLKGGVYTISLLSTQILAGAIFYFCAKGSHISLQEMKHEKRPLIHLRPYGDAGGWLTLCILTIISAKGIFEAFCGEAEYHKCQSLLKKHRKRGYNLTEEQASTVLREYTAKCIFNQSLASQKLFLINHVPESRYSSLLPELQRIDRKILKKLGPKNYHYSLIKGGQSIYKTKKITGLAVSSTMAVVLPVFLMLFAVFSLVGEIGLGQELFVAKTSLDDTGHFGEWLINFFEAALAAYMLHDNYMRKEGEYVIMDEIYKKEISFLGADLENNNQEKINLLQEIRKEELAKETFHYKKID